MAPRSEPDLFTRPPDEPPTPIFGVGYVVLPAEPTATQVDAALRAGEGLKRLEDKVLLCIEESEGRIPSSIAEELGADLVSVRARCTHLHQAGRIVRIPQRLAGEHVYVSQAKWRPSMGTAPSRPHRGRSSA